MRTLLLVLGMLAACVAPFCALGGPSLDVTKPPIGPAESWTGPTHDPHAQQGQWFYDPGSGAQGACSYEFHDNVDPLYGGGYASSGAILGVARNIQWAGAAGASNIVAFDIAATITNDTPSSSGWLSGTNSHGEYILYTQPQYAGTLLSTRLTIEFAVADAANVPAAWTGPYRQGADANAPFIIAANEDELAWYCWTPDNPQGLTPTGGYYVPAWDFGDIAVGQSVRRILTFAVGGAGLDPGDARWQALADSATYGYDLLSNRTTSLRISTWVDDLGIDDGSPWLDETLRGSNCSVFHAVPEPGVITLVVLGAAALLRRRF
jgi:hypothetical protein